MNLTSYPERDLPRKLTENVGCAFHGTKIYGQGFILTPGQRVKLVNKDPRNAERIFPYLGGKEVNTLPTQDFHRYVISFGDMSLEEASEYPDLLDIVREKVKPERDKLRDNADGKRYKAYWWRFGRWTPALYTAITPLSRCLVTACVTKHLIFSFQPTDRIFSHKLYAFPLDHYAAFAVLQSRLHEPWAWLLSSTMRNAGINYSASDCFDTFPFPKPEPRAKHPELERTGSELYRWRSQYMLDRNVGLTAVYNDPPEKLCELHEDMDRAVLAAYGWGDLQVPSYREKDRDFEVAVIDRLYELNAARART